MLCLSLGCEEDCTPGCGGRECGLDECGDPCNPACDSDQGYDEPDLSEQSCVPSCDGRECSDDGCGGICEPGCAEGKECDESTGRCVEPVCTPDCEGRSCGLDGCGRECEPGCQGGEYCDEVFGECVLMQRSCPFLFLPDPDTGVFQYFSDLAGSVIGYGLDVFRPEFYNGALYALGSWEHAVDAVYTLKIRETIFEADFFDSAELLVVDLPEGYQVHSTWSFTSQLGQIASKALITLRNPRPPLRAVDQEGVDVLEALSFVDEWTPVARLDGRDSFILDFGPIEHPEHATLLLTAWSIYQDIGPQLSSTPAAGTTLERPSSDGSWQIVAVLGKNAGDRHTWAVPIGGLLRADDTRLRLTPAHQPTGVDLFDQILLDDSAPVPFELTRLQPSRALLSFGGAAPYRYAGEQGRIHAEDLSLPINPAALMYGAYTRYGDVRELLLDVDDRFVVMAHGDLLELEFPQPPPPQEGFHRRLFLDADLFYSIKSSLFAPLTDRNEPLPFHGMEHYPYPEEAWPYRDDADYQAYRDTWNTRIISPPGD